MNLAYHHHAIIKQSLIFKKRITSEKFWAAIASDTVDELVAGIGTDGKKNWQIFSKMCIACPMF